jgi:hypothetical protein
MPATLRYPTALVTTSDLPTSRVDATAQATNHAQDHDQLALEVIAIEAELGINPSGALSTVAARFAQIQTAPTYTVTNAAAADRTIDVNNTSVGELLNVVATMIADLKVAGILT